MKEIKNLDEDYIQNLYIKIGKNVKRIRKEKKVSQLSLAHAIGHKSVTVISCCEICHKNYHFNIEHLAKIAYVLEVDINEFFKDI
ncbi:helix-turn-helix domain-containing protein [Halarcobacter sp.]|uniref:helix-turn-helix domain-containing protein n=1 Tax=Halarcobacter sp. TaxID=2321133 RepID=UPI003A9374C5